MADAPEAPVTPEVKSETTPNTNPEPAQAPEQKPEAPDMHGFTSEQLAEMKKFYDANGGFDKVKAKISNPEPKPAEPAPEVKPAEQPTEPATQPAPQPQTPQGAITQAEFLAQQYFKALAGEEKYAPIAKEIANGDLLKEMAGFNIQPLNQDGSINDTMVRRYLDLKAQTVPAKPTETEPNASTAPTVDYVQVGDKIESLEQAQAVFMQANHPRREDAKEFIRQHLNPNSPAPEAKK